MIALTDGCTIRERFTDDVEALIKIDVEQGNDCTWKLHRQNYADIVFFSSLSSASSYLHFVSELERETETQGIALVSLDDYDGNERVFVVSAED